MEIEYKSYSNSEYSKGSNSLWLNFDLNDVLLGNRSQKPNYL